MKKLIPVIITCFAIILMGMMASGSVTGCGNYPDVSQDDPYCPAIEYVQSLKIMEGQGDGRFMPEATLSRAEAAAVLVRYLNLDVPTTRDYISKFADADTNTWYSGYFDALIKKQIFEGYPDKTLRPGNTLNKAEWLKLFYVTQARSGSNVEKHVADVAINVDTDWYRKYVNDALENNLLDLNAGGFGPSAGQKRKLVADLIYRADGKSVDFTAQAVTVNDKDAVYLSRFGTADAHVTKEASYDLNFGWNYPKNMTFVWSGGDASALYSKGDQLVGDTQDLGKAVVGRFGFSGSVSDANQADYLAFVKAIVERYDGDGVSDMANLTLPIKYWQFDDNNMDAAEYAEFMKLTYEGVKNMDSAAKVVQGEILSLSTAGKEFWHSVYAQFGVDYFDIVMAKATGSDDLGIGDYRTFLTGSNINKPVWLFDVSVKSGVGENEQAQDLFKRVVKAFGDGADKVIYESLDASLSIVGDRKSAFFVYEALINYIDLFNSVVVKGTDMYEFNVGGRTMSVLWGATMPAGFPTGYVGVNYLGDELADNQFTTTDGPVVVWK